MHDLENSKKLQKGGPRQFCFDKGGTKWFIHV